MGTLLLLQGCCYCGDITTAGDTTAAMRDTSMVTGDTVTKEGYHCYRDATTKGMLLPKESCHYWGTTAMILSPWRTLPLWDHHCHGDAATTMRDPGDITTMELPPPRGN